MSITGSTSCPACQETGHDKTGNHLMIFADGNKFCNRSHHHKNNKPYLEKTNRDTNEREVYYKASDTDCPNGFVKYEDVYQFPHTKLESRQIPVGVCKIYDVRLSYSEETREVDAHYYPRYNTKEKQVAWKVRQLPKKFFKLGAKESCILFGQWIPEIKSARKIMIVGGEEDALAATTMTGRRMSPPIYAVSPPDGENLSCFELPEVVKFLAEKEEIYLALDNDEVGQKLTKKLVDLIGYEKVRLVSFSEKDVSDMLTKEKEKEFIQAVYSAKEYRPNGIVCICDLDDDVVCKPVEWGLSYPFESLTKITYGARPGDVIGIGAAPGAGKSTFVRQLEKHFIFEHKEKIAVYALEEGVEETSKYLIGSVMNKPIHKPDCEYDIEEAKKIKKAFGKDLYFFNCEEYHDFGDIMSSIRYFASVGVKYFFIDPLSALVAHLPPADANTWLSANMYKFEKMAKTLGITFYHTNHLNNPTTGKDHGAGGKVYGSQFSGSRAQWKFSTHLWGLERDQLVEDPFEKNIVRFSSIKARMAGDTSSFLMIYKPETGTLEEDSEMIKRVRGE